MSEGSKRGASEDCCRWALLEVQPGAPHQLRAAVVLDGGRRGEVERREPEGGVAEHHAQARVRGQEDDHRNGGPDGVGLVLVAARQDRAAELLERLAAGAEHAPADRLRLALHVGEAARGEDHRAHAQLVGAAVVAAEERAGLHDRRTIAHTPLPSPA
eukprot:1423563-Prymnesium_polylepis.1